MVHMNTPPISTKKIRVTVPVSAHVLESFKRMSTVSGQSVGRAMGEWLECTREGLEPMIDILEGYKSRPAAAIRTLQTYAQTLQTVTGDLLQRVGSIEASSAETAVEGTRLRGAAAAVSADLASVVRSRKRGLTPPSSNTGGKGRKTPKKSIGGSN